MAVVPPATGVVALALVFDILVSEFPRGFHPVALFGRVVGHCDRNWTYPVTTGIVLALVLPLTAAAVVGSLTAVAFSIQPVVGVCVAGVALFSTVSLRMLFGAATGVIGLTESDVSQAKTAVRALVGRETDGLSPRKLRSAAVESAAENLADGLVGPLFAFGIGAQLSVVVGIAAATALKAVNTMDSMLGYRSKPVGKASARLDDLLLWVPARVTALLLAVVSLNPRSLWAARKWVTEPSSPNSGWPMATIATVGRIQLDKPGAYTLNPDGDLPSVAEARRCVRIVGVTGVFTFILTGVAVSVPMGVVPW
ncbi:adenosylcobinamide-phosphate synthase CbiB [Halovenus rubra]|uniref:Adenosylcobinamide-phosphate synthase CbiB n=2 Tax=Halovenus rubra TaxID=869890 RepID=A0ACC7E3N4_9EURY|nr:adenosylcobinamide-phosphate synthase CbiB [Halovenus rubra]